jgi:hypothetical protein
VRTCSGRRSHKGVHEIRENLQHRRLGTWWCARDVTGRTTGRWFYSIVIVFLWKSFPTVTGWRYLRDDPAR